MAKDKNLALAFDFKDAPAEVQDAGKAHRENWLRLEKASDQLNKWKLERAEAQAAYDDSANKFQSAIDQWDPAKKSDPVPVEAAVKSAKVTK